MVLDYDQPSTKIFIKYWKMIVLLLFRHFSELQLSYRIEKGSIDSNHETFLGNRSVLIVLNTGKRVKSLSIQTLRFLDRLTS